MRTCTSADENLRYQRQGEGWASPPIPLCRASWHLPNWAKCDPFSMDMSCFMDPRICEDSNEYLHGSRTIQVLVHSFDHTTEQLNTVCSGVGLHHRTPHNVSSTGSTSRSCMSVSGAPCPTLCLVVNWTRLGGLYRDQHPDWPGMLRDGTLNYHVQYIHVCRSTYRVDHIRATCDTSGCILPLNVQLISGIADQVSHGRVSAYGRACQSA